MSERLRALHTAVLEIVSAMNRPQYDDALMREAGITLEGALFPLLVGIERLGPIGVVEIADRVGRDYTTVSRQIAKLEGLGLVARRPGATDRRVREAVITERGKAMTDHVDAARERMARANLASWEERDIDELVRLLGRLADAFRRAPEPGS